MQAALRGNIVLALILSACLIALSDSAALILPDRASAFGTVSNTSCKGCVDTAPQDSYKPYTLCSKAGNEHDGRCKDSSGTAGHCVQAKGGTCAADTASNTAGQSTAVSSVPYTPPTYGANTTIPAGDSSVPAAAYTPPVLQTDTPSNIDTYSGLFSSPDYTSNTYGPGGIMNNTVSEGTNFYGNLETAAPLQPDPSVQIVDTNAISPAMNADLVQTSPNFNVTAQDALNVQAVGGEGAYVSRIQDQSGPGSTFVADQNYTSVMFRSLDDSNVSPQNALSETPAAQGMGLVTMATMPAPDGLDKLGQPTNNIDFTGNFSGTSFTFPDANPQNTAWTQTYDTFGGYPSSIAGVNSENLAAYVGAQQGTQAADTLSPNNASYTINNTDIANQAPWNSQDVNAFVNNSSQTLGSDLKNLSDAQNPNYSDLNHVNTDTAAARTNDDTQYGPAKSDTPSCVGSQCSGNGPGAGSGSKPNTASQSSASPSSASPSSASPSSASPSSQSPASAPSSSCTPVYTCNGQWLYYKNSSCVFQQYQYCQYGCGVANTSTTGTNSDLTTAANVLNALGTMFGGSSATQNGNCLPAPQQAQTTCPTPPTQPSAQACSVGSWRPISSGQNGCTTGWQCVPSGATPSTQTPLAVLSCQPSIAEPGGFVSLAYSCQNATDSMGSGFDTGHTLSGTASSTVPAGLATGSSGTYGLTCINTQGAQQLTASAQCGVQVSKASMILVANPTHVSAGGEASLGWVTSGMQSCLIWDSDFPDFANENATDMSRNGTVMTPALMQTTTFTLTCTTYGGRQKVATVTVNI